MWRTKRNHTILQAFPSGADEFPEPQKLVTFGIFTSVIPPSVDDNQLLSNAP